MTAVNCEQGEWLQILLDLKTKLVQDKTFDVDIRRQIFNHISEIQSLLKSTQQRSLVVHITGGV